VSRRGTIYTETVVHLAPEAFAGDVPYQVAIVEVISGSRVTARIIGDRVSIGDLVIEAEPVAGAPAFRKA
jgi:uncharacterized OB-fold protein